MFARAEGVARAAIGDHEAIVGVGAAGVSYGSW